MGFGYEYETASAVDDDTGERVERTSTYDESALLRACFAAAPGVAEADFDYEYIETQSFTILNKSEAKSVLERQRNQLIAAEDSGKSQLEAMGDALNALINGTFVPAMAMARIKRLNELPRPTFGKIWMPE